MPVSKRPLRESDIEAYFVERIKQLGGIAFKFTSPSRRGVPDRMCCMPDGEHFFVELKAPGGKVSPNQAREHQRLRSLGHLVWVIDSKMGVDILWPKPGDLFK